jgi:uncharacterized ion transporter superfamily protein YfcC
MKSFRFPTAFTILFALIALMAALTWVVPVGQYERVTNEELGREVPVPGSFEPVESNPQGLADIALAPINGFYNSDSYEAGAIDVALFVLMLGGFLGVVNATGTIDHAIQRIMDVFAGREQWLIPILMALFAAGGTVYGMAEESLAFYAILIPIMLRAGYDTVTAVAVIMLGCAIGTLGSTINPFATVIASDAAGIAFTEGMGLRFLILGGGWLICVIYVMRYAARVHADINHSLVKDKHEENKQHFLGGSEDRHSQEMSIKEDLTLVIFAAVFAIMIWGVAVAGWWMARMAALFIVGAIVVGLVNRMKEQDLVDNFITGARDLLGVALIIVLARGIVVIMVDGHMSDTALAWSEDLVSGLSPIVFINVVYWIEVAMSFLVPSSSGLAVLSMPIMAPLGDFAGVSRDLVVTAFQSASGLVNMINPTFAVVMGGLAIGRVPYETWLKFTWPLLLILTIFIMAVLSLGTML